VLGSVDDFFLYFYVFTSVGAYLRLYHFFWPFLSMVMRCALRSSRSRSPSKVAKLLLIYFSSARDNIYLGSTLVDG